jgi:hypothetical protein
LKIYRLVPDVNHYQSFFPEDEKVWSTDVLTFDGRTKASNWVAPPLFILHPKYKRGNFFSFGGTIVLDARATELLRDFLEMSGELLPLRHEGAEFTVLNITECVNVLDQDKTKWIYGKSTGAKIQIERYAFHLNRMTETPLFKIPETCKSDILTATGLVDPEDEFKFHVESNGLQGLRFEELWNSEA